MARRIFICFRKIVETSGEIMTQKEDGFLQRFNHLLAWFTLLLFGALAISGFGMTNPVLTSRLTGGLFNAAFSIYLHANLAVPALILLLVHFLIGAKTALTRWGIKENSLLNVFLIILGAFLAALVILGRYLILT